MKSLYTKHAARAKRLQAKLTAIEQKYPHLNLYNGEMMHDMSNHMELYKQHVYATVDANACKSDNPDLLCEGCNCWKSDRMKYLNNTK